MTCFDLTDDGSRTLWLAKINTHLNDLSMGEHSRNSAGIPKILRNDYRREKGLPPYVPSPTRRHEMAQAYHFFMHCPHYYPTCDAAGIDGDAVGKLAVKYIKIVEAALERPYSNITAPRKFTAVKSDKVVGDMLQQSYKALLENQVKAGLSV